MERRDITVWQMSLYGDVSLYGDMHHCMESTYAPLYGKGDMHHYGEEIHHSNRGYMNHYGEEICIIVWRGQTSLYGEICITVWRGDTHCMESRIVPLYGGYASLYGDDSLYRKEICITVWRYTPLYGGDMHHCRDMLHCMQDINYCMER